MSTAAITSTMSATAAPRSTRSTAAPILRTGSNILRIHLFFLDAQLEIQFNLSSLAANSSKKARALLDQMIIVLAKLQVTPDAIIETMINSHIKALTDRIDSASQRISDDYDDSDHNDSDHEDSDREDSDHEDHSAGSQPIHTNVPLLVSYIEDDYRRISVGQSRYGEHHFNISGIMRLVFTHWDDITNETLFALIDHLHSLGFTFHTTDRSFHYRDSYGLVHHHSISLDHEEHYDPLTKSDVPSLSHVEVEITRHLSQTRK